MKYLYRKYILENSRNKVGQFIYYYRKKKEQLNAIKYKCLFLFHRTLSSK